MYGVVAVEMSKVRKIERVRASQIDGVRAAD
jgi:hypothetical protein